MILRAVVPAEGSPLTEGWVEVRLSDSQRAWLIHCLRHTAAPPQLHELAVDCVQALGGSP